MTMLTRLMTTTIYTTVGLYVAFPISYWFQSDIYHEMTWLEYIDGGYVLLFTGAQFGAVDIYHYTVIGCVIGTIAIGYGLEWSLRKYKK